LFSALTTDSNGISNALVIIQHIVHAQLQRLGYPGAGGIKKLQQRAIPQIFWLVTDDGVQQGLDLLDAERFRQPRGAGGAGERCAGIKRGHPLLHQVAVEVLDTRELPGDGPRGTL
jgi:hypothetical protein